MNKDVKTGMLIGLALVITAVIGISIWPGGAVEQRLMQAEGDKAHDPPPESTNGDAPPQENDPAHSAAVEEEMQRIAGHVIEELEQAKLEAGPRIHVVAEGETLTHIAHMHYGDSNKWGLIAEANKNVLPNINHIRPGMRLLIPRPDN